MRKKAVSPAHRRTLAEQLVLDGLCSQRAACRFLGLASSTYGYRGRPPTAKEEQLRKQLLVLSAEHPRYGHRRIAAKIENGEPVIAPGVPKNYPDAKKLATEDCIK